VVPYVPQRFGDACVSRLNDVVDNVLQREPSMITIDDGIAAQTIPRPSIVLMMADDQGWGETGYNGHPFVKTPVLDEMARSGLWNGA
jgi:hypothetical protein